MTADLLKLQRTGFAKRAALDELRTRFAASAAIAADRVVLLPSPESVGLLDLPAGQCTLIGPDVAPIAAFVTDVSVDPDRYERLLCDVLIDAGLEALRPAAQSERADAEFRKKRYLKEIAVQLSAWSEVGSAAPSDNGLMVTATDGAGLSARLRVLGVEAEFANDRWSLSRLTLTDVQALADRLDAGHDRRTQVRRTTMETDIHLALALDEQGPVRIETGIEYFDHMLEQIARHGGVSLEVVCEGDTGVDAHHTIEDVCLAFGEALGKALGDRRGIGRFGFELPMDETRAGVWIDLSGRPYCRFEGEIPGERVGAFPVEMAPHAFRSIADSLKAAIHVEVFGDNAHHMIEACFKAFGRALRQAVKIESNAIPSTKGVL
ncbi:imidazoleglycerol-phosphate dehydratase HisB [Hyphobacterium sp.]|uniref:imidazoleglycerol-phosphate dehydratase HisB n=1 Tax=Hyphobacterium sp. TaxID=2004662 RepID=UPI003B52665D